ncbi:MAG: hypothetical protein EXR48_05115 [Dehalococcoidia bacterium]|nr:hypothetical protein [Dehalococcoidia bacterium]
MVMARRLYELQQTELGVQRHQQALKDVRARLQDTGERDKARAQADATRRDYEKLRADLRDTELAGQQLAQHVKEIEQRLYSGRNTNPKELVSLQEDLKMVQRQRGESETRALELMTQAEAAENAATRAQGLARQAEASWEEQRQQLLKEQSVVEEELRLLQQQETSALATFQGQELALYQSLKKVRGGVAVAKVERGICRVCGIAVPSHDAQRARSNPGLVRCNSCGRILYVA